MPQSPFNHLVDYLRQLLDSHEREAAQRVLRSLSNSSAQQLIEGLGLTPNRDMLEAVNEAVTNLRQAVSTNVIDEVQFSETYHYTANELNSPYQITIFIQDIVNASVESNSYTRARKKAALKQLRFVRNDNYYSISEICRAWLISRDPDLEALILEKRWVATGPMRIRVFTMLKQGRTETEWGNNQRGLKAVVEACQDDDPVIAAVAQNFLWSLENYSLPALANAWAEDKLPLIPDILVAKEFIPSKPIELRALIALRLERTEILANSRELAELLKLCEDSDSDLANRARACLYQLPESSLDILYNLWVQNRQPFLVDVINQRNYLPKKNGPARVMVALQLGQWERIAANGKGAVVPTLAVACQDRDAIIAERAQLALAALQKPEAQQELCRLIIKEELPAAQHIALAKNYLPTQSYERVLFYFVTEQWDKYEALDFDYRILRTAYTSAEPALRRRLADKVRKAGRTEFLTVIAGSSELRGATSNLSREEAELLVQLLSANNEWSKLWPLIYELPLHYSVQIVKKLTQANWQPSHEDERLLLAQLQPLVQGEILTEATQIEQLLPPAVLRARARATGRINDVAFAPDPSLLALGTGTGKVILWNIQQGQRTAVLSGFAHSVGNVAYTKSGSLVCAETTNTRDGVCGVYVWHGDGQPLRMGAHHGPVTGLEAVGSAEQVLTTGRDCIAKLWNISEDKLARQSELTLFQGYNSKFWARGLCIAPDASEVVFLHEGATLIGLPQLNHVTYARTKEKIRCATFSPDGKAVIVGYFTGGTNFYLYEKGNLLATTLQAAIEHPSWQEGQTQVLAVQPNSNVVVMGKSDGTIHFNDWAKKSWLGKVETAGHRLTSLKLSPDGYFMAVGDSDASFSLWDLRPLEVRSLFSQNLAQASLAQMAALNVLTAPDVLGGFTPNVQAALQFSALILRQRFRHDIELEDVPMLEVGDFDIEIEG